jgi:anti-anti-sigma factor
LGGNDGSVLTVEVRAIGAGAVVRLAGELDPDTVEEARSGLERALAATPGGELLVDVAGLEFISASGLGLLAEMASRCSAGGGRLCLASPSDTLLRLLAITALDRDLAVARGGPGDAPQG